MCCPDLQCIFRFYQRMRKHISGVFRIDSPLVVDAPFGSDLSLIADSLECGSCESFDQPEYSSPSPTSSVTLVHEDLEHVQIPSGSTRLEVPHQSRIRSQRRRRENVWCACSWHSSALSTFLEPGRERSPSARE